MTTPTLHTTIAIISLTCFDQLTELEPAFVEKFPAPRDLARLLPRIGLHRKKARPLTSGSSSNEAPKGTISGLIFAAVNQMAKTQPDVKSSTSQPTMLELRPRGSYDFSHSKSEKAKQRADNMIAKFDDQLNSQSKPPVPGYATAMITTSLAAEARITVENEQTLETRRQYSKQALYPPVVETSYPNGQIFILLFTRKTITLEFI